MLDIVQGKISRPQRVTIYGVEGIGKSTMAAQFPDPLYLDLEGGTDNMDVKRIPKPLDWKMLLSNIREIVADPTICSTLVIDTIDQAESMCISHICTKFGKSGLEDFGYGKGYVYLREAFEDILKLLDQVIAAGINVLIIGHSQIRKFEMPEGQNGYDRYELKLTKTISPRIKEWTDILLFANYKTFTITSTSGAVKGAGGKRVMYATHTATWDAKNRHQLPDEMPLDYKYISHIFDIHTKKSITETLAELMRNNDVAENELIQIVAQTSGQKIQSLSRLDAPMINWIFENWNTIIKLIKSK